MRAALVCRKTSAYLLVFALQLLIAGCTRTPPEQAILEALESLETAIEAGDTGTLMDILTEQADIQRGNHSLQRDEVRRLLMGTFLRYPKRQLAITQVNIELDPVNQRHARVTFTAFAWGGQDIMPDNADSYRVVSDWREDGEWKIEGLTANGLRD
ncbi:MULTISPECIES: nuclear transport factor 2 family protein [Alcanivorax]|uniref:nuclear transport factor 2 family protein n=1 Tax=Alcanivorax TaxID=59753 RepID=UPI0025BB3784|nr:MULTISPECIES: nuclear transport factor 2 family protein [Alcanivorax]